MKHLTGSRTENIPKYNSNYQILIHFGNLALVDLSEKQPNDFQDCYSFPQIVYFIT